MRIHLHSTQAISMLIFTVVPPVPGVRLWQWPDPELDGYPPPADWVPFPPGLVLVLEAPLSCQIPLPLKLLNLMSEVPLHDE